MHGPNKARQPNSLIPHTSNSKLAREREKCLVSSGRVGWNRSDRIEIEEQGGRKEGVELKKMGTMRRVVKEKRFWVASFLLVWAAALQGHMMWMQRQDAFKQKFPSNSNHDDDLAGADS